MIKDRYILAPVAALLLCILGATVLFGWAISSPALVRIAPGSVAMSINTALMFTVAGAWLVLHARGRAGSIAGRAAPWFLVVLSTFILVEHIAGIDLPIDLAQVHEALGDGHAKPGRTAPNACAAFLFAGAVLLLLARAACATAWLRVAQVLSWLVLLIGVTAFVGYLMRLDVMYQVASFNRMATFTALGVSVLGVGLWSVVSALHGTRLVHVEDEAPRITKLAAGLLIVFAIATGLLSFAVLRESYERAASDYHENIAATLALSVENQYEEAALLSAALARRPSVTAPLLRLAANPGNAEARSTLAAEATVFETMGFRAVSIQLPDGTVAYRHGTLLSNTTDQQAAYSSGGDRYTLFRDGLFFMRGEHRIMEGGVTVATVTTERTIASLDAIIAQAYRASDSTDVLLCSRVGDASRCFPSRFYAAPPSWPLYKNGKPSLPISRALLGERGAVSIKDPRGVAVLAGFAPLARYNMGVVVKTEVRELYLPLRAQMHVLLGGMILFVVLGVLLLRRWLQPLIAQIIEERQRIKAILDNANDAFIGIGPDGTVSDWNKQAEQTLGHTNAYAMGKDLAQLIIPEPMRAAHNKGVELFRSTGTGPVINTRVEVSALHARGHTVPVELSVTAFQVGSGFGASAFVRDLSERRRAEQQAAEHAVAMEEARAALSQSQKLEAVGKLTGGVAHDFNNILQVISGNMQLLHASDVSGKRVLSSASPRLDAVERGAKLSAQLLAFARRQPLQPTVVNLARIVRDMDDMLRRALGETIEIEMVGERRAVEHAWSTRTSSKTWSSTWPSTRATPWTAGGQLTIELGNATLDDSYTRADARTSQPGQYVLLAVSDTGTRHAAEVLEQAFEPFFTTKPEGKGTGPGPVAWPTASSSRAAGHIKIYSELGHGTTVRMYLPRCYRGRAGRRSSSAPALEGGNETILVVEDDPAVQATVVEMLRDLGYRVLKADDARGRAGIVKSGLPIDLLFTDVVMPGHAAQSRAGAHARGSCCRASRCCSPLATPKTRLSTAAGSTPAWNC